ncbi:Gamma-tubulin complex component 3, partial [Tetrabaena socialis]
MSHFATNLQYYIQFEVMEASWQDFYRRAAACSDLDSLIAAHQDHLATLLRKALLAAPGEAAGGGGAEAGGAEGGGGPNPEALRTALKDALSNMVALRAVAGRLEEAVVGGSRLVATRAAAARKRIAGGGWGVAADGGGGGGAAAAAASEPAIPPGLLLDIRRVLADLAAQHHRAVAEFTDNLPE